MSSNNHVTEQNGLYSPPESVSGRAHT
ncbi:uncharacterized protein METZ01_LOCUS322535, partial [marine metagenome]